MSGHSKWHNIKLKKGKVDAQRGALFTKLSKEIILAAKNGSPDPEANYRLKMAVEKAREFNMPQDNIKRAIARASGQGNEREIEEIRYEGYGPHGLAVVADVATDNRNRTAGELRFLFSRHDGSLGESNSVGWMFAPVGVLEIATGGKSEDEIMEHALVEGVEDIEYDDGIALIYTQTGGAGGGARCLTRARHSRDRCVSRHAADDESRALRRRSLSGLGFSRGAGGTRRRAASLHQS